jgi:hypothetical protein
MVEDLGHSAPSYQRMSPNLAGKMRRQLPEIQSVLAALGAPESISIGRRVVVADQAGQCREIVLPGQLTRFHAVEPLRPDTPPGASAARRMTPIPGSDETSQQFIDGGRHGAPDYDWTTPEIAAATLEQLPRQQAILAKLGAPRSVSFRGVSPTGDDVYEVMFANGSATWQIGLRDEGQIRAVGLSP